jgi:hypothetical protein
MHFILAILSVIFLYSNVYAQSISHQNWQTATISNGTISILCAPLILPFEKGSLLVETNPTITRGEMDSSLRSPHPVRVKLVPQTGTQDDLVTISGCSVDGTEVQLSISNAAHSITAKHTPGSIQFVDGLDFFIDDIAKILTLVRKDGIWVPIVGGGGGGGGNIIVGENQRIDFRELTLDNATEGLFIPGSTNCAFAIGINQFCYNTTTQIIYIGDGTGIVPIGGPGVSGGCTDLNDCANSGKLIGSLSGRENGLKLFDENNNGLIIYVGAEGPVAECVVDYGGVGEEPCKPTETRTFAISPGGCSPDNTYFKRAFDVALNSQRAPVTFHMDGGENAAAEIECSLAPPDRWDGQEIIIHSFVHTLEPTPGGEIRLDWTGYCVSHGSAHGTDGYAAEINPASYMLIDLDGHAQNRLVITPTQGNVPVTGCTGDNKKILWLRAQVDTTATTASDLNLHHIFQLQVEYGIKAFTD